MIREAFSATILSALLSPAAVAPGNDPQLAIGIDAGMVTFTVAGDPQAYIGAAIASFSPNLVHYLVGLPPLLEDFVVLGVGVGETDNPYVCSVPEAVFPPGLVLYAQGVVVDLPTIASTAVRDFVLDVTVPGEATEGAEASDAEDRR